MISITSLVPVISIGFLVPKAAAQSNKYSTMAPVELVRDNKIQVGEDAQFPSAGVYAVVEAPGVMRLLDPVAVS